MPDQRLTALQTQLDDVLRLEAEALKKAVELRLSGADDGALAAAMRRVDELKVRRVALTRSVRDVTGGGGTTDDKPSARP
jgi:hypothetical protein